MLATAAMYVTVAIVSHNSIERKLSNLVSWCFRIENSHGVLSNAKQI